MTQVRRAAVLGSPIAHSLSPILHQAAYGALGVDWEYGSIDVTVDRFAQVLDEIQADPAFGGLSLTMPLKEVGLAAADIASDVARKTRAANTLVFRGGSIEADNTDPEGIVWALKRAGIAAANSGAEGTNAGIVGAGATARSAIAALTQLGVTEIHVVARRAEAIEGLREVAEAFGVHLVGHSWDDPAPVLASDVVVSTTPRNVADVLVSALPTTPGVLLDVVYSPWPTSLATAWADAGGHVVSGLEMLVGQAGRQVELMTGRPAPLDVMLAAGLAALGR
ncbi:MAG: shikimate dehydrogenase [Candidatus Nanopelagicales bacterium]